MRVAILCGGRGMRLNGGETPKALAEVKGRPLVEHVMSIYSLSSCPSWAGGEWDFSLLLGHLGDRIRLHYMLHDPWPLRRQRLLETGRNATTGQRLQAWLGSNKGCQFCLAYCDCLAAVDVIDVLSFHRSHGKLATLVAVPAVSSKGVLGLTNMGAEPGKQTQWQVSSFSEKPRMDQWVNFGFFVFEPGVAEHLDAQMLEVGLLPKLTSIGELMAYKHDGWYASVDSPKDLEALNAVEGTPWLRS